MRALPVLIGCPRSARAHHRRGESAHRRVGADAGLLHQHRRGRADGAPRFLRVDRVRDRPSRRSQVLHQWHLHRSCGGPPSRVDGLPRRADLDRRYRRTDQRRRAGPGFLRRCTAGHGPSEERGIRTVQDLDRRDAPQRRPARRLQGPRRFVRCPTARHAPTTLGKRRRVVARTAPDGRSATPGVSVVARQRGRCPHGRLLLPLERARGAASRPQHVWRRTCGVPHRPDRRRVRLPVRAARPVPCRLDT